MFSWKANTKESTDDWKKIKTDHNCGFRKLVSLTTFQGLFLLFVTRGGLSMVVTDELTLFTHLIKLHFFY